MWLQRSSYRLQPTCRLQRSYFLFWRYWHELSNIKNSLKRGLSRFNCLLSVFYSLYVLICWKCSHCSLLQIIIHDSHPCTARLLTAVCQVSDCSVQLDRSLEYVTAVASWLTMLEFYNYDLKCWFIESCIPCSHQLSAARVNAECSGVRSRNQSWPTSRCLEA